MSKDKEPKVTQKQCDDLLTPIIKKLFPKCLLCGKKTQVAHHHFKKERSLSLRYNLKNLIPLCNGCHFRMKWEEGILSCKIMEIMGVDWFKELDSINQKKVKPKYGEIYQVLLKIS